MSLPPFQSQITFLYYGDLATPAAFYGDLLGLDLVIEQEMARIYRVWIRIVFACGSGRPTVFKVRQENSVVISLTVDKVDSWYEHLVNSGVKILTEPQDHERAPVRSFFFEDPGGYTIEIQEFMRPEDRAIFSFR